MNSLDDLSLTQVLNELRPSDIVKLGIVDKVHNLLTKDPSIRYRLLKRWCPTNKTIEELQQYVPNITLQQISVLADYYYPTIESMNIHPGDELFYNACKAGYSIEDCMPYVRIVHDTAVATTIVTDREDILNLWIKQGKLPGFRQGGYSDQYIRMLFHRDMTIKLWVDTIIKYGIRKSYLEKLLNSDPLTRRVIGSILGHQLIRNSNHPEIDRLANHFGVAILPSNLPFTTTNDMIILRYKLDMQNTNDPHTRTILSRYDSVKFPSYDIFDDICSGNYLEVMRKANTWDRDILVSAKSDDNIQPEYISYTGFTYNRFPPTCDKYSNTRLETIGQCTLHMSEYEAEEYLDYHGLQLANSTIL